MIEIYKIVTGIYNKDACGFVKLWKNVWLQELVLEVILSSSIHSKLEHHDGKTRLFWEWWIRGTVPTNVITSKTVNTFKNRLDKYSSDQVLLYDEFKANMITVTGSDAVY